MHGSNCGRRNLLFKLFMQKLRYSVSEWHLILSPAKTFNLVQRSETFLLTQLRQTYQQQPVFNNSLCETTAFIKAADVSADGKTHPEGFPLLEHFRKKVEQKEAQSSIGKTLNCRTDVNMTTERGKKKNTPTNTGRNADSARKDKTQITIPGKKSVNIHSPFNFILSSRLNVFEMVHSYH